jgi:hypothetical protein
MDRQNDNGIENVEYHAEELVSLTFELCEKRLASARAPLTAPQKALSAAAMCVQQSVETFLHVSKIPDQPVGK